jgi:hypothetical protein
LVENQAGKPGGSGSLNLGSSGFINSYYSALFDFRLAPFAGRGLQKAGDRQCVIAIKRFLIAFTA